MLAAKSAVQGGSNFESGNEFLSVTIHMKDTKQSRGTVYIMLYEKVLTLNSVDKILKCDHSNEATGWC